MDNYARLKAQLSKYVTKYPLPSKSVNLERFKKLQLLREELPKYKDEYIKLRDTLIISNGGFAMKYAIAYCKKINNSSIIDDLFQQAQIGIIEAVDRFDTSREVNFTTFAFFYVRKCIIDYIKKSNKTISVNRNIARYIKHINEARDELLKQFKGFEPNVDDIKEYLLEQKDIDLKNSIIVDLLNLIELNSTSDQSFTTNNFDNIQYVENYETLMLFQLNVLNDLKELIPDQLELVKMRFGIGYDRPYNLQEIKFLKKLPDEEIQKLIKITELYI